VSYAWTHLLGPTSAAVDDFYVLVGNGVMKNAAYTLSNTVPPEVGTARQITLTHATVGAVADTLGHVTVVGKNLAGETITEVLTPTADTLITGSEWFASVATITGAGWTRNAGAGSEDTIIVGCAGTAHLADGYGTLHALQINTAAAGAITVADGTGTIATIPGNQAAGTLYIWDVAFAGFIDVSAAAATDVTVFHTGTRPSTHAM
jgi:hypothetical protein